MVKITRNFIIKLNEVTLEKDLCIFITSKLDWKPHINYAVNKANKQLGLVKHSFKYLNETTTKLLYKSLIVRPHLEYGAVLWNPFRKGDIDFIERVQHRATKIGNLKSLKYEERLEVLRITNT